jgi:hypothetical protein
MVPSSVLPEFVSGSKPLLAASSLGIPLRRMKQWTCPACDVAHFQKNRELSLEDVTNALFAHEETFANPVRKLPPPRPTPLKNLQTAVKSYGHVLCSFGRRSFGA